MLTGKCINPEIIEALSRCGHGSKILIADGNYPLKGKTGNTKRVYLGLAPGQPTVTEVLASLLSASSFEAAQVMQPDGDAEPEIFSDFRELLPGIVLQKHERYEFYDLCCGADVELAISTGEQRTFANILLTVGCA